MRKVRIVKKYYVIPENAVPQTRWLLTLMNKYDLNETQLAEIIHVSKQSVSLWVKGKPMTFGNLCAIVCMVIDKTSNPENLYELFNSSIRNENNSYDGERRLYHNFEED